MLSDSVTEFLLDPPKQCVGLSNVQISVACDICIHSYQARTSLPSLTTEFTVCSWYKNDCASSCHRATKSVAISSETSLLNITYKLLTLIMRPGSLRPFSICYIKFHTVAILYCSNLLNCATRWCPISQTNPSDAILRSFISHHHTYLC